MEFMKARIKLSASAIAVDVGQPPQNLFEVSYIAGEDAGKCVAGRTSCVTLLEMIFTLADDGWMLMFSADGWHFFQRSQPGDVAAVEGFSAQREFAAPAPRVQSQWANRRGQGQ